jgi:uncharacterized repeat protein (TIGR04138 family)
MKRISFHEALARILEADRRYDEAAYCFVREALDFTIKILKKPSEGPGRHVSGQELLDGIRQYALQEFGPLAQTVLDRWGVRCCEDFGNVVFNMVEQGILGKTEHDRREDFAGGYDFDAAFRKPYRARPRPGTARPSATAEA